MIITTKITNELCARATARNPLVSIHFSTPSVIPGCQSNEHKNKDAYLGSAGCGAMRRCNEYGTIYAISSDFGDRMTTQYLD